MATGFTGFTAWLTWSTQKAPCGRLSHALASPQAVCKRSCRHAPKTRDPKSLLQTPALRPRTMATLPSSDLASQHVGVEAATWRSSRAGSCWALNTVITVSANLRLNRQVQNTPKFPEWLKNTSSCSQYFLREFAKILENTPLCRPRSHDGPGKADREASRSFAARRRLLSEPQEMREMQGFFQAYETRSPPPHRQK